MNMHPCCPMTCCAVPVLCSADMCCAQAGVQYVQTEFKQLTGPEEDVRLSVGDEMNLNWDFDGFGDTYCYSDGRLFNNMGDFNCRSPVQIRIPDRRNHTFRVAMQASEPTPPWCTVCSAPNYAA